MHEELQGYTHPIDGARLTSSHAPTKVTPMTEPPKGGLSKTRSEKLLNTSQLPLRLNERAGSVGEIGLVLLD